MLPRALSSVALSCTLLQHFWRWLCNLLLCVAGPQRRGTDQFMINACINDAKCRPFALARPHSSVALGLQQQQLEEVEQQDGCRRESGGRVRAILLAGPQVEAGPPVVLAWY